MVSLKLLARFAYSESLDLIRSNSCLLGRLGSPQLHLLSFEFVPKVESSFLRLYDLHWGQQIFSCTFVISSNLLLQSLHSNSKIGIGYSFLLSSNGLMFWFWRYPTAEYSVNRRSSASPSIVKRSGVERLGYAYNYCLSCLTNINVSVSKPIFRAFSIKLFFISSSIVGVLDKSHK